LKLGIERASWSDAIADAAEARLMVKNRAGMVCQLSRETRIFITAFPWAIFIA
jgi:hypothetical protein